MIVFPEPHRLENSSSQGSAGQCAWDDVLAAGRWTRKQQVWHLHYTSCLTSPTFHLSNCLSCFRDIRRLVIFFIITVDCKNHAQAQITKNPDEQSAGFMHRPKIPKNPKMFCNFVRVFPFGTLGWPVYTFQHNRINISSDNRQLLSTSPLS